MHVLVVEDEIEISKVLAAYLGKEGWTVRTTADGHDAVAQFDQHQFDLILLDLMISGMDGEAVCRKVRERSNVPIIMITSKSRESDMILGLELGADDYIVKPIRIKEVIARIHSLFRRIQYYEQTESPCEEFSFNDGKLLVRLKSREVLVRGKPVHLTPTEFKLLDAFIRNPGKVLERSDLTYFAQGYRYSGDGRSIDSHVKNLRKKIEENNDIHTEYITTQFGTGYKFTKQPD